MQAVYDFARTVDRSIQWSKTGGRQDSQSTSGSGSGSGVSGRGTDRKNNHDAGGRSSTSKNDSLETWGPAKTKSERSLYRRSDRCFKCGFKGYRAGACNCKSGSGTDPKKGAAEESPKE